MHIPRFAVRPRTLLLAMLVVVVATGLAVWLTLRASEHPGAIELAELSEDSTATVGLAGVFPADESAPLLNPLGIATDGDLLYVAESDAGRVRIFDENGGEVGAIGVPKAKDSTSAYPSSVAVADDDRIAIVDNAGARVVVVVSEPAEQARVLLTLGRPGGQPTSVAFADGEYFVFDAAAGTIAVYDAEGEIRRTLGEGLEPPLAFASGMAVSGDTLFITDSNGGRVLALNKNTGVVSRIFGDRYTLPRAVAPLREEGVAVVDAFERAVYLTGSEGERRDAIDAATVPEGPLSSPRGAVWYETGSRLYVTDAGLGRVVVFNVRE